MAATYEPISTTTLGSAASSITFSSIPGTYTDLRLVLVGSRSATGVSNLYLRFNGDNGTNYSLTALAGDGTTASSTRGTSRTELNLTFLGDGLETGMSMYTVDVFSYAGSTYKTALWTNSIDKNGSGTVNRTVGLWSSTSAINQVVLSLSPGNFATGTTATLYGILKA